MLGLLQGVLGALPDLEPRAQRDPAEAARLEHPPERPVLPDLPRRDAPRDGDRAARVLLARLGADPEGARAVAARPRHRSGRHRREARLAARRRDDPGRHPRADARRTRCGRCFASPTVGLDLPDRATACCSTAPSGCAGARRRSTEDDDARIARTVSWRGRVRRRCRAGARADPGLLAFRRDDGRRLFGSGSRTRMLRASRSCSRRRSSARPPCSSCPSSSGTKATVFVDRRSSPRFAPR